MVVAVGGCRHLQRRKEGGIFRYALSCLADGIVYPKAVPKSKFLYKYLEIQTIKIDFAKMLKR